MVARFFILSFLFTLISPALATEVNIENKLELDFSRTEIQLGQHLRVTLKYRGSESLQNINLKSWLQLVAISYMDEFRDEDAMGNTIQVLKLRLYPRNTGTLTLPELKIGTASTQAVNINILQAIVNKSPVTLNWEISTTSPWQREAVVVHVHLLSSDISAHVLLDSSNSKDFLFRPLKPTRRTLKNGKIIFDTGWVLHPLKSGITFIDFPAIRYQLSGSDRRRFYLPLLRLKIKPLPSYLPPDLAIGKLNIQSQIDSTLINQWKTMITTHALIPFGVPDIDRQLAEISGHDISNIKMKYTQLSSYENFGDKNIYYTPQPKWLMPFGKDLNLTLRYFNPQTGRLEETNYSLPRVWTMPQWAWWLVIVFCLFISAFFIKKTRHWGSNKINRLKLRKQFRAATSPQQIRQLILYHGPYITLSEWSKDTPGKILLTHKLNKICFADKYQSDLEQIKHEILKCF